MIAGATAPLAEAELGDIVASGSERFEAALEEGGPEAAYAAFLRIEAARRETTNRYRSWSALTDEYVFAAHGHRGRVEGARPERTAELALRSGFDLDDLALAAAVATGPVNAIGAAMAAAVERGDREAARAAWRRSARLLRRGRDFRCDLLSDQLGSIYRRHGAVELEAAMRYAAEHGFWRASMPADLTLEPRRRLRDLAFFLSVCAHFRLRIEDEGQRWRLDVLECGRCGRQCRDRYTDPDWGLEVVAERSPLTFGRPPMTIYQTHLAVIHHMFAIDEFGAPWPVFDCRGLRDDAGGCRMYVYKDPADTPAAVYEEVGRVKPKAVG